MTEAEFWLLMEVKQQTAGQLTHADYEEIQEFFESRPKTRMSIKHGRKA